MRPVLIEASKFLGRPIPDFRMDGLIKHLSFSEMKYNFFCNYQMGMEFVRDLSREEHEKGAKKWNDKTAKDFLRKGQVGSHKEEMSPEYIKKFDEWIAENIKNTGIRID